MIYGIYLGSKQEVVFYANNKEVWNILGMGILPTVPLMIGSSFLPENFDPLISNIGIGLTTLQRYFAQCGLSCLTNQQ